MESKALTTVLIVILCALFIPAAIGIIGGVFGIVGSILGGIFGLIGGIFGGLMGLIGGFFGAVFGFFGWLFGAPFHWHFFGHDVLTIMVVIVVIVLLARSKNARSGK
jgi:hypothetical protein